MVTTVSLVNIHHYAREVDAVYLHKWIYNKVDEEEVKDGESLHMGSTREVRKGKL